jgi:signal transduction histidine kinase
MLLAVRNGAIVGAVVAGLVVVLALVPPLSRGYPLALIPLLAVGPVAVHHAPRDPLRLLLKGLLAGLVAALLAVAAMVFAVEVMRFSLWSLVGPASYPPMPPLPHPDFLPGVGWPHENILLMLPPLSALLALAYGTVLVAPEAGVVHGLAMRLARLRASIEDKLVWLLLTMALLALVLGWVGFSALEDIHLGGHRIQLLLDWVGHTNEIGVELQELTVAARLSDSAARQELMATRSARLTQTLDHFDQAPAHTGIALGQGTVREIGRGYTEHVRAIRAAMADLVSAADAPGNEAARLAVVDGATAAAYEQQLALSHQLHDDLDTIENNTDLQHHASLMALLALVILAALASVLLGQAAASSITRPVGTVTSQLSRIAGGDFSPRVEIPNRDELGELATQLNTMAVELDRLYAAEHAARQTAEELNQQLTMRNHELETTRLQVQEANERLEQRVQARTAELERAHEELRQAQKMEAVGRLAGGVAHDFNNLLTVINGFAELLSAQLRPGEMLHEYADQIHKAGDRATDLTRQLLAFSRRQPLEPRVLDLNGVIRDMEGMLRRLIGEDVRLETYLQVAPSTVLADPGQLQQVILNLAVNARDAMPHGGALLMTTTTTTRVPADDPDGEPVPHVLLAVADTGVGMDAQTRARIFDPFFTTKAPGMGTGLGLSTVYGVVQQSGGDVVVESTPGVGTIFRVFLPLVTKLPLVENGVSRNGTIRTGQETILLVEDEPQVRDLAHRILAEHGYQVIDASDADQALAIEATHPDPIHLLLADVVMQGLSGPEAARALAQRRPELRVLFMSGYPDEILEQRGLQMVPGQLMPKPFSATQLLTAVRHALDA